MERYEYMFLILKPIKVTFKTYGNYIHFTLKQKKKKKPTLILQKQWQLRLF